MHQCMLTCHPLAVGVPGCFYEEKLKEKISLCSPFMLKFAFQLSELKKCNECWVRHLPPRRRSRTCLVQSLSCIHQPRIWFVIPCWIDKKGESHEIRERVTRSGRKSNITILPFLIFLLVESVGLDVHAGVMRQAELASTRQELQWLDKHA